MGAPKITIDKYAIRFEDDAGGTNHFFIDLFTKNTDRWHYEVLSAIQKAYEICVIENIQFPKETDNTLEER